MKTGALDGCGRVKKAPLRPAGLDRDVGLFPHTRSNLPAKWMLDFDVDQR